MFEKLDEWIRRKLRCVVRWQWKRTYTRVKGLMKRRLKEEGAWNQ